MFFPKLCIYNLTVTLPAPPPECLQLQLLVWLTNQPLGCYNTCLEVFKIRCCRNSFLVLYTLQVIHTSAIAVILP